MYVLGVDLETTGLSSERDQIIEVGAVVWDTRQNKPVTMMNRLINIGPRQLEEEIIELTGIEQKHLREFGVSELTALNELIELSEQCKYVVAHNGPQFDKVFLERAMGRYDLSMDLPWIDTLHDVPYRDDVKTRKLTYLATEHKFLNPFSHRALFDVLTMMEVVSKYDWDEVVELSKSPTVRVQAIVSYDERSKAKEAGFRWDAPNKVWIKDMKQIQLETTNFPFLYETSLL